MRTRLLSVVAAVLTTTTFTYAAPSSRLLYLHRCGVDDCVVTRGAENSRTNTSSIAQGRLGSFTQSDATWNEMIACVKRTYAPFDIQITEVDPGAAPHFEMMVGGSGDQIGFTTAYAGVAPLTCFEVPNGIGFAFDRWGADPYQLCASVAHESGHMFGLTHVLLRSDPMGFDPSQSFQRYFQPEDAACGETEPRPCDCHNATTQNSVELLLAMFGVGVATAPTIDIAYPRAPKPVQPGFTIRIDAVDDLGVASVDVQLDGAPLATLHDRPYKLVTDDRIAPGQHTLTVTAIDHGGTAGVATTSFVMGPPCTAAAGCSDGDVCVSGLCIAGPNLEGGLGTACIRDSDCLSEQCVATTDHERQCVAACSLDAADSCPTDFACIAAGDSGVCWMVGSSGCCQAGTGTPIGTVIGALGVLGLALRSRRRPGPRT